MIESLDNATVKALRKLKQKKYRDREHAFLAEGHHLVEEAVEAGVCKQVIHTPGVSVAFTPALEVSETVFASLSDVETPQGILAVCEKKDDGFAPGDFLLLDRIRDPGNLGTLLRSAKAFGFDNIVLDACVDVYNPKVLRATQGTLFNLRLKAMGLRDFFRDHAGGLHVYGTDVKSGSTLSAIRRKPGDTVALLLGNEGSGVDPDVLREADSILSIDMAGTESLNVAIAGAIIMQRLYERKET